MYSGHYSPQKTGMIIINIMQNITAVRSFLGQNVWLVDEPSYRLQYLLVTTWSSRRADAFTSN